MSRALERLWHGGDPAARVGRALLRPAEGLYALAIRGRGLAYDLGWLRSHEIGVPAVSIGNLSVGGTGKTPVSAWFAGELRRRGAAPAIVLRGYGDDEPLVHARLNPDVPVVVAPDRVAGAAEARRRGADVVVLDDAFQHRRARRTADVVLLSADSWTGDAHLLPAGPWREPLTALRRASLVIVTRKAAGSEAAARVQDAVRAQRADLPVAIVHLAPGALVSGTGGQPLDALRGRTVHAIAAIGEPRPFLRQLEALGARVRPSVFGDHHRFSRRDADALAAATPPDALAVCTLKDAVKLEPLWPRVAPPLWYVSQRVLLDQGRAEVERLLDYVLRARSDAAQTVG